MWITRCIIEAHLYSRACGGTPYTALRVCACVCVCVCVCMWCSEVMCKEMAGKSQLIAIDGFLVRKPFGGHK